MIVTVDDEASSDNDTQLNTLKLIAVLNVSLSSYIISLKMSTLNDDDFNPTKMVTVNTSAVEMA